MSNHVLVTGSAGTIGRAVLAALVDAGLPVIGFDVFPTPGLAADRCVVATLGDTAALQQAATGARCILHLAATPDDARFPRGPSPDDGDNFLTELVPNNIVGTYSVMEAARKARVSRVILASTGQVIAGHLFGGRIPVDDQMLPQPRYLYACTKVFTEAIGYAYANQHEMEVLAVRLGWCMRPGQEEEFRQSEFGPDVYLSTGDAGRFFLSAVRAEKLPKYAVVYACSKPARRTLYDMTETTRLTGYVPQDTWSDAKT
jgi:nucleoside-diphosphate-sugar epimerase